MQILQHTCLLINAYFFSKFLNRFANNNLLDMFICSLTFDTILSPFFKILSDTSAFTINADLVQPVSSILVVLFSANQQRLTALQVFVAFHPADQTIFKHVWRVFLYKGVFVEGLSGTVRKTSLENYWKYLSNFMGSLYSSYNYLRKGCVYVDSKVLVSPSVSLPLSS